MDIKKILKASVPVLVGLALWKLAGEKLIDRIAAQLPG